jgi:hypothetical protein
VQSYGNILSSGNYETCLTHPTFKCILLFGGEMWLLAEKLRSEIRMVGFHYLRYCQITRKNRALKWYDHGE